MPIHAAEAGGLDRFADDRLTVTVLVRPGQGSTLADDVRRGLALTPKALPPKHFYDQVGSRLFDAICDTPEYYLTRTEHALLDEVAGAIVDRVQPTELIELGSGVARKTRVLLDALAARGLDVCYLPVDVSEAVLIETARRLLGEYPRLRVHALVADYERHLRELPAARGRDGRRLIAFLGSSLGNFDGPASIEFLGDIAAGMQPADRLLLGLDRIKDEAVLHAAYNDAAGLTAEFNRNLLRVINRELGADFDPAAFEHVARYVNAEEQIEMHLRARAAQRVNVPGVDRAFSFAAGEMMRTEISRKWSEASAAAMLAAAGLRVESWFSSPDQYFSLVLATRAPG